VHRYLAERRMLAVVPRNTCHRDDGYPLPGSGSAFPVTEAIGRSRFLRQARKHRWDESYLALRCDGTTRIKLIVEDVANEADGADGYSHADRAIP
jgi:hypothetical protein